MAWPWRHALSGLHVYCVYASALWSEWSAGCAKCAAFVLTDPRLHVTQMLGSHDGGLSFALSYTPDYAYSEQFYLEAVTPFIFTLDPHPYPSPSGGIDGPQ